LKGLAKLTIAYPDYGVSLSFVVMDGVAGKRLPGGTGLTATIDYKGVSGLKPIAPASFNVTEGSTAVTLEFPVYNLKVFVYDWYGSVKLEGLNATMTWPGQTVVGAYNATEASYLFEQLPAGGTYTVNVYTNETSPYCGLRSPRGSREADGLGHGNHAQQRLRGHDKGAALQPDLRGQGG